MSVYKFRTKPYKHQAKAVKRLIQQGSLGMLFEAGTGKTKVIIDAACALHMKEGLNRVLVCCPLSVVGVWEEEVPIHAPFDCDVVVFDRSMTELPDIDPDKLTFVIVNYDLAWRRKEIFVDYDPEFVVSDESHRIKRASTNRSRFLRSFNTARHRAILTGTPAPRSYLDLYGQWVFLNPGTFGTRISDFKDRYLIYGGYMNKQIKGYTNLPELKKKVHTDAMVVKKEDALDLPPKVFQSIPVELEETTAKMYDKLEYEFFLELERGEIVDVKTAAVKVMKLQQVTGGFVFTDQGVRQVSKAKLTVLRDLLEDRFDAEQRIVVFCRFRPEIDAIRQMGIDLGVVTYVLAGGTKREERDLARRLFQSSPGPSLFVAQIQTGGLGITLHKSSEAIFYSVTFALDDYLQACDRLHRIGQENKVIYRHLIVKHSVDEDIYASLQAKENLMNLILSNPTALRKRHSK